MDKVLGMAVDIAKTFNISKMVLFGSRARGDHTTVSDYDIAVFVDDYLSDVDKAYLCEKMEEIPTLKKIQLVFVQENLPDQLLKNIHEEGVLLYEQACQ